MRGYHKIPPSFVLENVERLLIDRIRLGLTCNDVAQAGQVSVRAVKKYETREQTPRKETYNRLAELFCWEVWE